jgi:hypothetical protein
MATAYTTPIPSPEGLPPTLTVRVVVMRHDGGALSPEERAAAAAVYPSAEGAELLPAAAGSPRKAAKGKPAAKGASAKAPTKPRRRAA